MNRGFFFFALMFISVLLTGCGDSKTVDEIQTARHDGDPARAIELATESLKADSDQMEVWCQLAYANLDLIRLTRGYDDSFPYVMQSAMMCAALEAHEGKLPGKWEALKPIARGQLIARARTELNRIDDSYRSAIQEHERRVNNGYYDKYPPEIRNKLIEDARDQMLKNSGGTYVDPAFAREIVWKTGCYSEFLKQMGGEERDDVRLTQEHINSTLNEWPNFSDLDPSFVTDIRADAVVVLNDAFAAVKSDLEINGHFTIEHVLKMDIMP